VSEGGLRAAQDGELIQPVRLVITFRHDHPSKVVDPVRPVIAHVDALLVDTCDLDLAGTMLTLRTSGHWLTVWAPRPLKQPDRFLRLVRKLSSRGWSYRS
jgi:hypothetical protein